MIIIKRYQALQKYNQILKLRKIIVHLFNNKNMTKEFILPTTNPFWMAAAFLAITMW